MDMSPKGTVLANTVAKNKSKYINRDYSRAVLACKIIRIIGHPIKRKFRKIIANKQIKTVQSRQKILVQHEISLDPILGP